MLYQYLTVRKLGAVQTISRISTYLVYIFSGSKLKRDFEEDYGVIHVDYPENLDTKKDMEKNGQGEKKKLPPGVNQEHVHVAFTSDENTLVGTVAAINSIWKNSRYPVKFLLVTNAKAFPILRCLLNMILMYL